MLLSLPDSETLHEFRRTVKTMTTRGTQAAYLEALGLPGKLIVGNDGVDGLRLSIMHRSSGMAIVAGKLYLPARLLSRGERAMLSLLCPSSSSSSSSMAVPGASSLSSSSSVPPSALEQDYHDDQDANSLLGGIYLSIPAPSSPPTLLQLPLSASSPACAPDCPVSRVCSFLSTSARHRPWVFVREQLIRDWEDNLLGLGVDAGDLSGRQGTTSAAEQESGDEPSRRLEGEKPPRWLGTTRMGAARCVDFRCDICGGCAGERGGR